MEITEKSTLYDLLRKNLQEIPQALAYRQYDGRQWVDWTWDQVGREVARWQAAFAASGLKAGDRVALCLHNRVEWVLFDQAALGLGLVVVPLYFDDRADNMAWCLNNSGSRLLLLEQGSMWNELQQQTDTIERVICLDAVTVDDGKAQLLRDWLPADGALSPQCPADAEELATIVYTSGTTGRPKGVMLSHRNIMSNAIAAYKAFPITSGGRFLSFLPLSHMFERTTGYYCAILAKAQVVYARSITLLGEDLQQQKPTILISVPRIFEKIYARLQAAMPKGSPKRKLFDAATNIGWRRFNKQASFMDNLKWPILKLLVANKLFRRMGGRMQMIVVGGAAYPRELARVFNGLGLPVVQGYGLTETSPVICANRMNDNDPVSIGRPLEGIEVRCSEEGELLSRGPNTMMGYWKNEEATRAAIDEDGWFHTGDIAEIRGGRTYITGRMKEVIVMSSGEKVPPNDIEQAIMVDTAFQQIMLIGEGRPKLGLLVYSDIDNVQELCDRANKQLHDFPGFARICHVARVAEEWTVDNGMLTPTLKIKRKVIEKHYAGQIDDMYQERLH